ncbi:gliding motility-associated C-terminal domain-containing protein [Bacteroidota bacterium]
MDYKSLKCFIILVFVLAFNNLYGQNGDFVVEIFSPDDTINICQDEQVEFKANAINSDGSNFDYSQVTFKWSMGINDEEIEGRSFGYKYTEGGIYIARLVGEGPNNNYSQNTANVVIKISPDPFFMGSFSNMASICSGEELILSGEVYPNPWVLDSLRFENSFNINDSEWFGNGISIDDAGIARANPPLDNGHQEYSFQVKDNYGCYFDTTITVYGLIGEYSFDPTEGEAPLDVIFTVNNIENGGNETLVESNWEFYEVQDSTIKLNSLDDFFTFEKPGEYSTKMIASYDQCSYTFIHDDLIHVDSSLLEIPNVFTPNGDGINDFFQVKSLSLKSFDGIILNRWGKKVFEWTEWKEFESGWDGKINRSGKDAPEGVYFYIIKAVGWDDVKYRDGVYKGTVHLFR